jgi:signal transduction histidine kinase
MCIGIPAAAAPQSALQKLRVKLRVEVQDAGKGVPAEKQSEMAGAGGTGVGMSGMRERLRQFGGHLEIESVPGLTTVVATIPIPQPRANSASSS